MEHDIDGEGPTVGLNCLFGGRVIVCLAGGFVTTNGRIEEVNPITSMAAEETFVKVIGISVEADPPMSPRKTHLEDGE
jgi:hypothetical protein